MRAYTLEHLSDATLLRDLDTLVAGERTATAVVLAHIAEVDARRLYLPAGFPSMFEYCVGRLRLSEDAAYKRIQAARTARQFPAAFALLADGRLHLTGLGLLAPHLTPQNAAELLAMAANQRKSEIEAWLAQRFPRSEMLAMVTALPAPALQPHDQLAPAQVAAEVSDQLAPAQVQARVPASEVKPQGPQRFALHLTIDGETHDLLRYAQELLSHRVPSGDVAEVVRRALVALVGQLEKRKFAATAKPRPRPDRPSCNPRHIPAEVKRAVWERDQGRCTFVGETGQRCPARKFLEFDHVDPVARGGQATVEGVRIRCRGHNQYEAERIFGAGFMDQKRDQARRAVAAARLRAAEAEARARAAAREQASDVMAGLRQLGFRADQARRAAEDCETIPGATLEERMRAALRLLCPKTRSPGRVGATLALAI